MQPALLSKGMRPVSKSIHFETEGIGVVQYPQYSCPGI